MRYSAVARLTPARVSPGRLAEPNGSRHRSATGFRGTDDGRRSTVSAPHARRYRLVTSPNMTPGCSCRSETVWVPGTARFDLGTNRCGRSANMRLPGFPSGPPPDRVEPTIVDHRDTASGWCPSAPLAVDRSRWRAAAATGIGALNEPVGHPDFASDRAEQHHRPRARRARSASTALPPRRQPLLRSRPCWLAASPVSKLSSAMAFSCFGEALGLGEVMTTNSMPRSTGCRRASAPSRPHRPSAFSGTPHGRSMTSRRATGGRCCPQAKRGYSRDGKSGTLPIVCGLLRAPDGCPVASRSPPRRSPGADTGTLQLTL